MGRLWSICFNGGEVGKGEFQVSGGVEGLISKALMCRRRRGKTGLSMFWAMRKENS